MKRNVILAAVTLVAFAAGTWVGFLLSRRNVVTYAVPDPYGGSRRAVHLDWPTYGLPLVEYQHFLELLDAGRTNLHRELLDGLLDMALFDASFRRPELPAVQREILDTAIADTAAYRQVHPRSVELGDPADTNGYYQKSQATVDALLDEVSSAESATFYREMAAFRRMQFGRQAISLCKQFKAEVGERDEGRSKKMYELLSSIREKNLTGVLPRPTASEIHQMLGEPDVTRTNGSSLNLGYWLNPNEPVRAGFWVKIEDGLFEGVAIGGGVSWGNAEGMEQLTSAENAVE